MAEDSCPLKTVHVLISLLEDVLPKRDVKAKAKMLRRKTMEDKMRALEFGLDAAKLAKPPHILSQLMDIVTGDVELDTTEQEQLLEHLVDCEYCQTVLVMLVGAGLADDNASDSSENIVRELLARQRETMRKKHANYEQIAAYIETLEVQGQEEANKKYPALVEHLQHCLDCRNLVESTRTLLTEMAKDEMNQANKVNTQ